MALRVDELHNREIAQAVDRLASEYGYEIPDRDEVIAYLRDEATPDTIAALQDATTALPSYFPKHARRSLRISSDPEHGEWGPLFVVLTVPDATADHVYDRLDAFETNWWIPQSFAYKSVPSLVFSTW